MKRRTFIGNSIAASALPFIPGMKVPSFLKNTRMGLSQATYAIRWKHDGNVPDYPPFQDALDIIDHCHQINGGGVQVGVGGWDRKFAGKVRAKCEKHELYFEGQIRLPQENEDISRFESDLLASKEAGAGVNRAVCLSGRRYANFGSMEEFLLFKEKSMKSLERAEPVLRKHRIRLALENHKDWRADEMVEIMKRFDSEWIGVTLDTGNNVAFLEDPMYVIEKLAPYAYSTHIKDMAYSMYEGGILLSEVPLGEGIIDLEKTIALCKKYNPDITFNLEMITRDPLKVPCLTEEYWVTFDHAFSGRELALTLKQLKEYIFDLPTTSDKDMKSKLAFEELNNIKSLRFAENNLGLS